MPLHQTLRNKIQPMAANMESTTSKSPRRVGPAAPETLPLESAIIPAPTVEARTANQPPECTVLGEQHHRNGAHSAGSFRDFLVQLLSGEQHRRNGEQDWQGTDHQSSMRNRREGESFELKEEYDGTPSARW